MTAGGNGIWDRNLITGQTWYSPGYTAMLGYAPDESPGQAESWTDRIHPQDKNAVLTADTDCIVNRCSEFEVEFRMRAKDGRWRWILGRGRAVARDDQGRAQRMVGTHTDITARKLAEERLRQSEQRFREIADSMPARVVQLDRNLHYVYANSRLGREFGLPGPEGIGMHIEQVVPKDVWEIDRPKLMAVLAGETVSFEYDVTVPDGSTKRLYAHYVPQRDETGQVIGVYCWTQDITARTKAESRYRAMFETIDSGVAVYAPADPEGTDFVIRDFNPAAERITGKSRDQVLGRRLLEQFPGIEKIGLLDALRLALKTGQSQHLPAAHVRFDNRQGWRENLIYPMPDNEVVAIFSDVTERKHMEKSLVQAKEAAEEASRIKTEFLTNMSHEVRTPLNGIMGMLQLMRMTGLDPEQQEFVDNALLSSRRLTDLLSDILDISVVESGVLRLTNARFRPLEVLTSVENLHGLRAQDKNLTLSVKLDPAIPNTLVGDEQRLRQVLFNLVGNACKFTSKGEVSLEVHSLATTAPDTCRLLFTVADTGIGIPDDIIGRLFKPFAQASEGFTRQYQGAGLGLSICKRMVTLMGGTMAVESEPGTGTSMHVCLPFGLTAPDPARRTTDNEPDSGCVPKGLRVLLAEDDAVNSMAARHMLVTEDCLVTTADDGGQAIDTLREGDFDVVLMDIQMPVMDGMEATKAIREGRAGKDKSAIPIIAVTAYTSDTDIANFLKSGMTGCVAKPMHWPDMEKELARVLGFK